MKCFPITALAFLVLGTSALPAATIALTNSDALSSTSFNTGLNWANGQPPGPGNAYQTVAFRLRTPNNTTPLTFAGDSLEVQNGGDLRIKTGATITINNFILDNGATVTLTAPAGGTSGALSGNLTLNGTSSLISGLSTDANGGTTHVLTIGSIISGTGGFNTTTSSGTIILTATNTYSGLTTISGGKVLVNGLLAGPVTIASGTLGGVGTIRGTLTNQSTGTLRPGLGTDTSTLTVSNYVTLAGTTILTLNRNNAQNASRLAGVSTLTQGGTLIVTNGGPTLQIGDTFTLFSAANYNGAFNSITLPALPANLLWSNALSLNGTLTVVPITLPSITNLPASQVLATSANLNGQVISPGISTPSVVVYYGTNDGGANAAAWSNSVSLGPTTGGFSAPISGLATNTTYYFTAFATNSAGFTWATPSKSFTTLTADPFLTPLSVLTYHYDNTRQGANTNETLLVPGNVNTNTFGKIASYQLDGYVYTEPLILTNVAIPGQGMHNVVFVATEHNSVYALDADGISGTNNGMLWKNNFGLSANSAAAPFGYRYSGGGYNDIVPEVGMTGTPVIDPATGTLYVDSFTRDISGFTTNYVHRIHALDVTTGEERPYSPVIVAGSVPGTGAGSSGGIQTFSAIRHGQRPALCLANGMLIVAFASFADTDPYHGWVFAYNSTNLALQGIFNTTPNAPLSLNNGHGGEGGIWQGGGGICVDSSNNLYFETGNGSFSANTNGGDYGDSIVKLSTTNGLAAADYFTPFDQSTLEVQDNDLGSSGSLLLPDQNGNILHPHLLVGSGKSGKVYLVDRDNMGHWQSGSDSQIVQSFSSGGGMYSPPTYWNNFLYLQPAGGAMKAFSVSNAFINPTAVATAPASFGGQNGSPVISANGTNNGIVWVLNNNSGNTASPGTLYALNALNISQMLWNSAQMGSRDSTGPSVKMTTLTVAGGKVYVGGQYSLSIYGLASFLTPPVIQPSGGVFTNSTIVTISNTVPGSFIYYTLDGSMPTTNSTLYTGPFAINATETVKAIAAQSGYVNSAIVSASFINTSSVGNGTGLQGAYYSNHTSASPFTGSPTLVRIDPTVNFDWGAGSPDPSITSNTFTARWTGSVQPQFTEDYLFYTTVDEGVRLWVNGELIIDVWTTFQGQNSWSGKISLKAQQLYNITFEYFDNSGNAFAQLAWSSSSTPQAIIPQTQLYPFTNPPPSVLLTEPVDGTSYTADASVTVTADAAAPYNPISAVNFYLDGNLAGSVSNVPYTLTLTGVPAGSHFLQASAIDGSGLTNISAPVNITVSNNGGQPYGLTNREIAPAFYNMPNTSAGSLPPLLSMTGVFSNTPNMSPVGGLISYTPNVPLWSDSAIKTRYVSVPNNGNLITPDEQIAFAPTGSWTFPAGTVFVKTFELNTDTTNPNVKHRLETRLLVRDINGAVYGVTYKWRADNSEADLLASSLTEDIVITNATGVSTQTWYYPSPSDCLQCHTPQANYVLGLSTRQLNGNQTYSSTGVTDNQLRTFNRLGLFNPAFDETNILSFRKLSSLTNNSMSFEERARSYLDANCAQCHQPGGSGITFDARYDTPLESQRLTNYPASYSLGFDAARIVAPKDVWRSMIWQRMNTTSNTIKMPPLARNLIDSNAVDVIANWINNLPGTPALVPPTITPNGGLFYNNVGFTLQSSDPNAEIYFTLDGTLPTTNSLLYSNVFNLTSNATISASAFRTGYVNSAASSALFSVQPLQFTSQNFSNGVFRLKFLGAPGSNYVLLASTNFVDWTPLATNPATTNVLNFIDPGTTNFPKRFYRVLQQ